MTHASEKPSWMPNLPTRTVRCYRCANRFEVAPKAMSASCPHCHRRIVVSDIVIRQGHWGGRLETCGSVIIQRKARAHVGAAIAGEGVCVLGIFEGSIVSGGTVHLGDHALVRGSIRAPFLLIDPGAVIDDARLEIPGNAHAALTGSEPEIGVEIEVAPGSRAEKQAVA